MALSFSPDASEGTVGGVLPVAHRPRPRLAPASPDGDDAGRCRRQTFLGHLHSRPCPFLQAATVGGKQGN